MSETTERVERTRERQFHDSLSAGKETLSILGSTASARRRTRRTSSPAAVLRAVSQQLKTDLQTQGIFWGDYCYFAGISGDAFRFLELMKLTEHTPGKALVERLWPYDLTGDVPHIAPGGGV